MFRSGDVIEIPGTGVRLVFRRTAAETGGGTVVAEAFLEPNGLLPGERVHPRQELRLEVLAGLLGTSVGGRRAVAGAGTRLSVPAGTPHRLWNAGDEVVHLVAELAPALGFESLVASLAALDEQARASGRRRAGLLRRAVVAEAHFDTVRRASPPALFQRLVLGLAAPLGRALGYRGVVQPTLPGPTGSAS